MSATELFRKVFVHNLGLKLVSLLLACGLWLAVARDPIAEVEMRVPIEFQNFPENMVIDSPSYTEAQVRVRGSERLISRLRSGDVHVEADLAGVRPGQRTFYLSAREARAPQDIDIVQIVPSQLQLSFDTRLTRTVEVHPRVVGTFASGVRISQVTADPSTIGITGPRRRVEAVEAAITDPVDATGTVNRGTFVTQASVPDPLIQVVRPTPIRVTVMMEREQATSR